DTMASGSTTSFEGSRPIDVTVRGSAISRRLDELGLTISLAIGALSDFPAPPRHEPRLDVHALLDAGREPPGPHGGEDRLVELRASGLADRQVGHLAGLGHYEGRRHGHPLALLQ